MWSAALIFSNKNYGLQKKHFIEKIWKSYQITCLTHMTLHAIWGDEITRVLISIKTRFGARFTNSSYKTKLWKMTSHFESLTQNVLHRFFFRVTNSTSWKIKLNFELLTRRFNFYFSTFELLTRSWKTKSYTSSY